MSFSPVPPALQVAMAVPGRSWRERQVLAAFEWIFRDNFARLVRVAAHRLGCHLASEAEDECQNFAMGRFRRVVLLFDPGRGRFEGYVVFCLKRYCGARARVLARRAARSVPMDAVDLVNVRASGTPETRLLGAEARASTARLAPCLRRALLGMSPRDRRLLQMEFRGVPVAGRAGALVLKYGATKVAAFRARERLARKLGQDVLDVLMLQTGEAR